ECELGWTGGICPVTMCAKGLVNGACGGAKNGKCEVSPDNDCAWVLIYERLKELGQLDNLKEVRPPKDYSKQLNPRRLDANKKASAEA
ncbi:MAG: methylenetetrahydrofolate reductase C-terminal domain-containing protein, partial [Intestinibacter bartlettii]